MLATRLSVQEEDAPPVLEDQQQINNGESTFTSIHFHSTSEHLFPFIPSESESQFEKETSDIPFSTWHPRRSRQSITSFFPVVDDTFCTPRKPASHISVDSHQSLPDMQTFLFLWFKMTSPQSFELANDEMKPQSVRFFTKSKILPRKSLSGDVQTFRKSPSSINQTPNYLETVMIGGDKCASGQKIVDWLVSSSDGKIDSREKACNLCEAYLKASFLKPLDSERSVKFIDGPQLYRIREDLDDSPRLPRSARSIDGGFGNLDRPPICDTLMSESITLSHLSKKSLHKETRSLSTVKINRALSDICEIKSSPRLHQKMLHLTSIDSRKVYSEYLERLIRQETRDHYLPIGWVPLISETVNILCSDMCLDLRGHLFQNLQNLQAKREEKLSDGPSQHCSIIENKELQEFFRSKYSPMNILRYIHVKKVLGDVESFQIMNGVVFTGRLLHKHLPTQLFRPRILLLASSITYERNIYKRTWLDSYAAQEEEYLGNCVTKILSLRPTVLLIEGGIANIALDMLVKSGIAIFCNVKRSTMTRLAASTGAEIVKSTDDFLSGPYDTSSVGTCRWYKLLTISQPNGTSKPVCIFCFNDPPVSDTTSLVNWFNIPGLNPVPASAVDCHEIESASGLSPIHLPMYSVILRGPDLATLKLVKRCFKLALLTCFNGGFEIAFLEDAQIEITDDPLNKKMSEGSAPNFNLARRLSGRLFNLSPLVETRLPFLASAEAIRTPLFKYYYYLIEWPPKQRLNDALRQKVIVMRRKLYPVQKILSQLSNFQELEKNSCTVEGESGVLRRWTARGRMVAASKASSMQSAKKNSSPPSKPHFEAVSKRFVRSVRDPRSHLLMYILRSVYSISPISSPRNCVMPWIIGIEFYSDNDLPLGAFLEYYCFRTLNCLNASCKIPMLDHVQRFTQTTGTVEMTMQTIDPSGPPDGTALAPLTIMVGWYCPTCKQTSQYRPLSQLTWHFSLMKFIDLLINSSSCFTHNSVNNKATACLSKGLHIFFTSSARRVTFCHKPTMMFDISMPPLALWTFFPLSDPLTASNYANSIIEQHSSQLSKKSGATLEPVEMPDFLLGEIQMTLKKYYEVIMRVKTHLMNLWNEAQSEDLTRLLEAFTQSLNLECAETGIKSRVEVLSFLFDNLSAVHPSSLSLKSTSVGGSVDISPTEIDLVEEIDAVRTISSCESCSSWMIKLMALSFEDKILLTYTLLYLIKRWLFNFVNDWNTRFFQYISTVKLIEKTIRKERKARPPKTSTDTSSDQPLSRSQTAGSLPEISPTSSNVDLTADETDAIDNLSSAMSSSAHNKFDLSESSYKMIHSVNTVGAVKRIITAILPGSNETKLFNDPWPPVEHPQIPPPNRLSPLLLAVNLEPVNPLNVTMVGTSPICAKEKLVERLSEIRISDAVPDVYVSDQEVTSIIAYALATENYAFRLQALSEPQTNMTSSRVSARSSEHQLTDSYVKPASVSSSPTSQKRDASINSLKNLSDGADLGSSVPDDTKLPKALSTSSVDPHIEIRFADASTSFLCCIYYAEEFHQLRKLVFPQGETAFIRSLSRCHNWDAQGGKSGSSFMKTHDERFVVKELSPIELKTFHDIKDQYFNYLTTAVNELRLSLLARIFGIFHIDFKNSTTGEARRLDVLVMENLFHNRPGITQIYDLKGCLRGRLINTAADAYDIPPSTPNFMPIYPTSSSSVLITEDSYMQGFSTGKVPVLLDGNFIIDSIVNPIYLRLHSKNALMHCLQLDTQFLADLFIMDYSLLVGVDRITGQLVMGIIDYFRKFTLDKRLEMFVKQALSSVQGPMPTIILPVDYRERLLDQMDRNFYVVPDQWYDSLADHKEGRHIEMSGDEVVPRTKRNLTIVLICDCFYPNIGGVESHIYQLSQCLLSRGHRVIIITHSYGTKWQRQGVRYMAKGLKVYYIPYRPFYSQSVFITVFGEFSVVRDIFIRENVDIVHGHSAFSPLALESLTHAKALGLCALFTDHSLFGFADLSSVLGNRALFMFLNAVDSFICVSNVAKENTVLRGGMEPERVYVIPNAIDSCAFTPDPSRRDPNNITVVIISRLVYRKGADLMAAIIPPMCNTFPNLRFIIGGDGPKRLALEEMRERHNLHFRVEMLGALPHHKVRDVLVRGDIFLNVSLTESFCIAIVEAASCGLLVVSTKVGGVPEVLPLHMMRLAPVSASGLASTLANAIEEIRQQRLQWSQETILPLSESDDAVRRQEHSRRCSVSTSEKMGREKMREEPAENVAALSTGCSRTQRTSPPLWPPASAVEVAWRRHREIRLFYTWHDVARRTELAYHAAMSRPRITPLEAAIGAYRKLGPVCGKIMAAGWFIEWMILIILEWFRPSNRIDRVPYFSTTPSQFEMWDQMETSPYEAVDSENPGVCDAPKKYTLKRRRTATSTRGNSPRSAIHLSSS
ncbi:hypothetical protein Aperf_G00000044022 [Anoplocephala perfoliata]